MTERLDKQSWPRIVQGDTDVWRRFISRQIKVLYGVFMKRWPNPALAEELVQRTLFDAVRGRGTYDPAKGSPEQWIIGIARNNVRLEIRRRAGWPSVNGDISSYLEAIDIQPLPDEVLEHAETAQIVRAALDRLQERQRLALTAKYVEGLSAEAVGRRMNITAKAVHSLLHRAKRSFREQLQQLASADKGIMP